jgi:hypothetical protein
MTFYPLKLGCQAKKKVESGCVLNRVEVLGDIKISKREAIVKNTTCSQSGF